MSSRRMSARQPPTWANDSQDRKTRFFGDYVQSGIRVYPTDSSGAKESGGGTPYEVGEGLLPTGLDANAVKPWEVKNL
jgi:hypothetical protein